MERVSIFVSLFKFPKIKIGSLISGFLYEIPKKKFLELSNFSKTICFEIGDKYYFDFDAIGSDDDHIHLFVGAEPKYSPSIVMQIIKSITARQIF